MEDKRSNQLAKFVAYVEKQKKAGVDNLAIWGKVVRNKSRWNLISDFEKRYYTMGY